MNFNEIKKTIEFVENEEFIKNVEHLFLSVEETNKEFTKNIIEASEKQITPEDEDGKKLVDFGNMLRKLGYKLLNLLHIEITCSFAGVTLFHWSIPKVEDGKCVEKISKKSKKQ